VLGDAYEYLIGQFASGAGKKAGEFYTPQEVSTILAKIVTTGKNKLKSVYDPTCGSGSLLLRVAKEVEDVGHFYGQEMNPTTFNLARMNMILHGVHYQRFDLKNEDTLEHPAPEHADLRFEAIVANPPFSANWSASPILENDDRFSAYGKLAPKTKADFAFVQHMVHHLDHGATMACVLPHGVLFRGAAEGHIRKYLIEDCNCLDAVIGLPANIFFGTGIPTCILVLKKQRENPDDILFIDASQGFEKVGNQNHLRPEHVEQIISTYQKRESIKKFSHVAERSEVAGNDYNLNIPRYVDTFDEEEAVNLDVIVSNITAIEEIIADADDAILKSCAELGLPFPAGHNRSLLEAYKKGVMQKLFTQALRFKDDHGNEFPDWEEKTVGDVAKLISGQHLDPDQYDDSGEGVPYFTGPSDFTSNSAKFTKWTKYSSKVAPPDSILICVKGNGVGKLMYSTLPQVAMGRQLMGIRSDLFSSVLLYQFLLTKTQQFVALGSGNLIPGLSRPDILTFSIPVPSLLEQAKIANFLTALDRKIDGVAQQVCHTQAFKKGLLQQMFV
jgi:type I restriction enzyme M protein